MLPISSLKKIKLKYLSQLKKIIILSLLMNNYFSTIAFAQFDDEIKIPEKIVSFEAILEPEKPRPGEHARVILNIKIHQGWHIFSVIPGEDDFSPIPTTFKISNDSLILVGPVYESNPINGPNPILNLELSFHEEKATLFQNIKIPLDIKSHSIQLSSAKISYQACSERVCLPPRTQEFSLEIPIEKGNIRSEYEIPQFAVDNPPEDFSSMEDALKEGFWGFIALAVIAGFLALLTPCVFPMIPITVAFFTKQGKANALETLKLAALFGMGIVVTYTITGMLLSIFLGAAGAVKFATNGWVNLVIGLMFVLFALSLMGYLELNIPRGLGNFADRWSRSVKGGIGVLAMGFAFTLTSFTCTVQFVGTLLIAASQGMWFWPIVGMIVFSTVFAIPFFLLGLFPRLIQLMQSKSGNWMMHLKIILGLLELAAAFKFFSNSDLVWQIGLIDRSLVLFVWVILCFIAVIYLSGRLTIHNVKVKLPTLSGYTSAFIFGVIGVYLLRGFFGIPLNPWVDTYLPPTIQTFTGSNLGIAKKKVYSDKIVAHSLPWQNDLTLALKQAKSENKRVFIDFTGYTCINCRWMEENIFSQPEVMEKFKKDFKLVQLFTDGGDKAEENQNLQISRFKTVALPLYVILDSENNLLTKHTGILKPVENFLQFLN